MNSPSNGKSVPRNDPGDIAFLPPGIRIRDIVPLVSLDPTETRILAGYALGLSRIQLITQSERELTDEESKRVSMCLHRRIQGEPVAYIVGEREFFGLPFQVTPDVLIPRPETELLVELGLERLPKNGNVLDLGTGSGAVAIAIAHERPDATVTAVDISAAALAVARANAERNLEHHERVVFRQGSWYAALEASSRFDLIVSNPPYITEGDRHLSLGDLRFEPPDALTDHADGLSAIRSIAAGAVPHLKAGGWLLIEHGYDQAGAVRAILARHGMGLVQSWRDLAGIERVTGAIISAD